MRRERKRVPTKFARETRFAVLVTPAAPLPAAAEPELERLKHRLLGEWLAQAPAPEANDPLRRAGDEATSVAWTTHVPLLVLPELFREKAEAALRYVAKQASVRRRSRPGMDEVA